MQTDDSWKEKFTPIQKEIDQTKTKLKELETAQREMQEGGQIETAQYAALQSEIQETSSHLKRLKKDAEAVNREFGNPISHDQYNALQRNRRDRSQFKSFEEFIGETEQALKDMGTASEGTSKKISGLCDVINGGAMLQAAETLSGLSGSIVDIGNKAQEAFGEVENATSKASAYFGETGRSCRKTADIIKKSMEQALGTASMVYLMRLLQSRKILG